MADTNCHRFRLIVSRRRAALRHLRRQGIRREPINLERAGCAGGRAGWTALDRQRIDDFHWVHGKNSSPLDFLHSEGWGFNAQRPTIFNHSLRERDGFGSPAARLCATLHHLRGLIQRPEGHASRLMSHGSEQRLLRGERRRRPDRWARGCRDAGSRIAADPKFSGAFGFGNFVATCQ